MCTPYWLKFAFKGKPRELAFEHTWPPERPKASKIPPKTSPDPSRCLKRGSKTPSGQCFALRFESLGGSFCQGIQIMCSWFWIALCDDALLIIMVHMCVVDSHVAVVFGFSCFPPFPRCPRFTRFPRFHCCPRFPVCQFCFFCFMYLL